MGKAKKLPPKRPFGRLARCKFCGSEATNYSVVIEYACGSTCNCIAGIFLSEDTWSRTPACEHLEASNRHTPTH
jgi:hypothetical protein